MATAPPLTERMPETTERRPLTRPTFRPRSYINVGSTERWLSVLGGGALMIYGLSRRSLGHWALAAAGGSLVYRGLTGHCPLYQTLDVSTAKPLGPVTSVRAGHGVKVEKTFTVNRSPEDLYRFWRDFQNLPRFMRHLESVQVEGDRSHWVACGPMGFRLEWDAVIHTDRPNELISWRSLDGSEVDTAGSVHFTPAPGGRGTEVRVVLKYDPPGGKFAARVAQVFGQEAGQLIREDLRRFKQLMEAGEVPTIEGQPSCRNA